MPNPNISVLSCPACHAVRDERLESKHFGETKGGLLKSKEQPLELNKIARDQTWEEWSKEGHRPHEGSTSMTRLLNFILTRDKIMKKTHILVGETRHRYKTENLLNICKAQQVYGLWIVLYFHKFHIIQTIVLDLLGYSPEFCLDAGAIEVFYLMSWLIKWPMLYELTGTSGLLSFIQEHPCGNIMP